MIRTGIFALIVLLPNFIWASTASVRLLSERHRTEWNWDGKSLWNIADFIPAL